MAETLMQSNYLLLDRVYLEVATSLTQYNAIPSFSDGMWTVHKCDDQNTIWSKASAHDKKQTAAKMSQKRSIVKVISTFNIHTSVAEKLCRIR